MENTIEARCHRLIHGLISDNILDFCGYFILTVITNLVFNTVERRHLLYGSAVLSFLLRYLLERLCPKHISRILSYIYIFICKHLLLTSIPAIGFSIITTNPKKVVSSVPTSPPLLTTVDIFSCFIFFIVLRLIEKIIENRYLFLMVSFSHLLLIYFLDVLCQEIIKIILSEICSYKHNLKSISNFCFSLVSKSREKNVLGVLDLAFLISRAPKENSGTFFSPSDDSKSTSKEVIIPVLCLYVAYFLLTSLSLCNKAAVREKEHVDIQDATIEDTPTKDATIKDATIKDVTIKRDELTHVMERICLPISNEGEQMKDCMGYEEFNAMFQELEPSLDEVKEAFSVFDQNRDGLVDARDLQGVLSNLGLRKGADLGACERMIAQHDRNGDSYVDLSDFSRLLEICLLEKVD